MSLQRKVIGELEWPNDYSRLLYEIVSNMTDSAEGDGGNGDGG